MGIASGQAFTGNAITITVEPVRIHGRSTSGDIKWLRLVLCREIAAITVREIGGAVGRLGCRPFRSRRWGRTAERRVGSPAFLPQSGVRVNGGLLRGPDALDI